MNKLPTAKRAQIFSMLVEGMSMRSITRITRFSINTVAKLLNDAGHACAAYHHEHHRRVRGHRRVECDEIWAFVYAKESAVPHATAAPDGTDEAWTFTAIDADAKLILSYLVSGERDGHTALAFMDDIRSRLEDRPQLFTDRLVVIRKRLRACSAATWTSLRSSSSTARSLARTTSGATARPCAPTSMSGASKATPTCARQARPTSSVTTSACGWGCGGLLGSPMHSASA